MSRSVSSLQGLLRLRADPSLANEEGLMDVLYSKGCDHTIYIFGTKAAQR